MSNKNRNQWLKKSIVMLLALGTSAMISVVQAEEAPSACGY